jgi:hypothetical protein
MSETVRIPIHIRVFPADAAAMAKAQQIFLEELRSAAEDCVLHVQERVKLNIEKDNLVYTSHLLNSIATAVVLNGLLINGYVGTNLNYAKYPEFGTVPHFVPFNLAPSLYEEMQRKFGWVKPDMRKAVNRALKSQPPGKAVSEGPGGLNQITGKKQTYLVGDATKLWLQPNKDARPVWGLFVSGRKRPYLFPGWEQSLPFITNRLQEGCRRAADRCKGGD